MMDCLPSDKRGQPLSAARDLNFHNWAWRIPETGFPLITAYWMSTFPNHVDYFKVVFLLGGTIGNISWLMFVTLVHPRDEPLDRDWQCLRYIINPHYRDWDAKRRLGLVGPELVEREKRERGESTREKTSKAKLDEEARQIGQQAPAMANCCDKMCFGQSVYEDAQQKLDRAKGERHRLYTASAKRKKAEAQQQESDAVDDEEAGAGERAPLLGSSPKKSLSEQGSLQ